MKSSVHFSSASDNWATPPDFFAKVTAEFGRFDLDVCASADNHKARRFFTKEHDGLAQEWSGLVWMNPPYGRTIGDWMRKAHESSTGGGYSRLPHSRAHRYRVVARLRRKGRSPLHSRASQVRWSQEFCAVSICSRHLPA